MVSLASDIAQSECLLENNHKNNQIIIDSP